MRCYICLQIRNSYFQKEQILLEYYLNTIYFQNGVYGIEAVGTILLSRAAKDLSLAEMAFKCDSKQSYFI
ncbi:transglycosylase domain-containing protein [Anaerobacillus sp. HL2]|nr:transglycosylase domain-containing protein [Anaerobacillus sp. HL2]